MAEETKTAAAAPEAHAEQGGARVFCFVSKHEILESEATQIPYLNNEKVWVAKKYIQYKQ